VLAQAGSDPAAAAIAGARLSTLLRDTGELSRAFAAALEARTQAERCEDPVARSLAWLALGHVFYSVGQHTEARSWLDRAAESAEPHSELWLRARMASAATLRAEARLDEATVAFDALAIRLDEASPTLAALVLINAASCWHQVNRLADAQDALDRARGVLTDAGRGDLDLWVDAISAWVAVKAGDPAAAVAAGRRALASQAPLDLRSSAVRALALATDGAPALRSEVLAATRSLADEAEQAGARQQAVDLHLSAAKLCEASQDLAAAVVHLRSARAVESQLADDTERLRLQQERLRLELARMQVEADLLRTHSETLAQANRALAAADGARARLLRTLAHDLRNPLTSVMAAATLMDPNRPQAVRARTAQIEAAAVRMRDILDEALRGDAEASRPRVDAASVARQCVSAFEGLADRKGQRIQVEALGETHLQTDPGALGRALDNLLSNALKYSGPDTLIRVVVSGHQARVDLSVLDQGPGLPELDPQDGLLYGRQLAARATGGEASWGLGLHTAYELVAELGGLLALGNQADGGAVVRISLPRRG